MGLDDRGVERGKYRVEDCDCTEFISSTDSISCGYCGDPPAKHQNENPPTNSSSSTNRTIKSCSSSKGAKQSWMDRKLGYIQDPKRKTGQFYNNVLKDKLCTLQVKTQLVLGNISKKITFLSPHDIENLQRLSESASKIKDEVEQEINNLKKEDDSLFCSNGKLKSGREFNHSFNEDTTFKMKTFIMDIIDPFLTKITDHKEKAKQVTWKNRGKKEQINNEIERIKQKLTKE
ncbi:unnamed protein product [Mytilus coruscus]|uniref:Uncharacterized protein n=1 Tax=Mytilus coruscus TaxID=42192 RepID=A0A6J8BLA1_MYTCO|nr:unnamed protein product [Mytilus coruscus]